MKDSRKLKIHTKYRPSTRRATTIPVIKLEGKWLSKLGFNEGQMINIEQKKNKLIITIEKSNSKNNICHFMKQEISAKNSAK